MQILFCIQRFTSMMSRITHLTNSLSQALDTDLISLVVYLSYHNCVDGWKTTKSIHLDSETFSHFFLFLLHLITKIVQPALLTAALDKQSFTPKHIALATYYGCTKFDFFKPNFGTQIRPKPNLAETCFLVTKQYASDKTNGVNNAVSRYRGSTLQNFLCCVTVCQLLIKFVE